MLTHRYRASQPLAHSRTKFTRPGAGSAGDTAHVHGTQSPRRRCRRRPERRRLRRHNCLHRAPPPWPLLLPLPLPLPAGRRRRATQTRQRLEAVPRRRDPCARTLRTKSSRITERCEKAGSMGSWDEMAGAECACAHHLVEGRPSSSAAASARPHAAQRTHPRRQAALAGSPAKRCVTRDVGDTGSLATTTRAPQPRHKRNAIGRWKAAAARVAPAAARGVQRASSKGIAITLDIE